MYKLRSRQGLVTLIPHSDKVLLSCTFLKVFVLLLVLLNSHKRHRLPALWGIVVPSINLYMVWHAEQFPA